MRAQRILCVVKGDETDAVAVDTAVDLLEGSQRRLFIAYVILVDRRMALDANLPAEVAKAERILRAAETMSGLSRDEVQGEILQGRSLGPSIVSESFERNVSAVVASFRMRSEFGKPELDADAEYLIKHTPCALVLVREPLEGFEDESHDEASSPARISTRVG